MNQDYLERKILEKRAKLAIEGKISMPCGQGCPMVCCDPIVVGSLLQKADFDKSNNYSVGLKKIQANIEETLQEITTDNKKCFSFEGILIEDVETDYGFISDEAIEAMILNKVGNTLPRKKIEEYIKKTKEHFKSIQVGILLTFSCEYYDKTNFSCTIHETRPQLCRQYSCEQLEPKKVNNSKKELMERLKIKKDQREYILKNVAKEPLEAIKKYFEK